MVVACPSLSDGVAGTVPGDTTLDQLISSGAGVVAALTIVAARGRKQGSAAAAAHGAVATGRGVDCGWHFITGSFNHSVTVGDVKLMACVPSSPPLPSPCSGCTTHKTFPPTTHSHSTTGQASDMFIAKVAPDGSVAWVVHGGGENADESTALAYDGKQALYVTGFSLSRSASFGMPWSRSMVLHAPASGRNGFILKVRSNFGNACSWMRERVDHVPTAASTEVQR